MVRRRGFTLIELLVVLSIIAVLLSIAAPRYFRHVELAKEAVLRENLAVLREAIDQYAADKGHAPATLEELADARYVRAVPVDPLTGSNKTWVLNAGSDGTGIEDVHSGAPGYSREGASYADW